MGIGASIFLIAIGAILAFALDVAVGGVNLDMVGWILMGAGVLGLLWSLIAMNSAGTRSEVVVEREEPVRRI
ncbi:MAG: DUF6458 family protein [Acidimicrobiia bacterium]